MPNSTVSSTVSPRMGEHMVSGAVKGTAPIEGFRDPLQPPDLTSLPCDGMRRGSAHAPQPPRRTL